MSTWSRHITLNHSATTHVDARVVEAMVPYLSERFANSESSHTPGQTATAALEQARGPVAGLGRDFISADSLGANQMAPFEVVIEDPQPGIAGCAAVVLGF